MVGVKTSRIGWLAVLPLLAGGVASAQTLDLADKPDTVPTFVDPAQPADLQVEESSFDFGRISDDDQVEHTFVFTNKGTGTLYISNAKGSCSCTVPALAKKQYAPGESGEIRVIFNPKSKAGTQHQNITITSNDADMPVMMLNISAFVRPEVMVEPRVAHFGEVPKDTEKTIEVVVTGRNPEFSIESVELSDSEYFTAVVGETKDVELPMLIGENQDPAAAVETEEVRQCTITLTMKPGQEIGLIRGKTMTITTNDPKRPPVQVELMAQHKGDLDMMPRRITFGALNPGEEFHQQVTIKSLSGTPFKVLGIEHIAVAADALDYSFSPVDPANPTAYQIEVDGDMPVDTRVLRGRLLIRTDLEREEEMYLYYYAQARPPAPKTTPTTTPATGPGADKDGQ